MYLKSGLKIYSHLATISEQLLINGGTKPAPIKSSSVLKYSESGLKYSEESYLPIQNWRELSKNELKILVDEKSTKREHFSKSIYLGDISPELKKCLQSLNLASCDDLDEIYPKFTSNEPIVKEITKELDNFLRTFSSSKNYKFHRLSGAMPGRETVTRLIIDQEYIYLGLHIDQSRYFNIHTAYKSGNRISINLSNEPRALIFINLTMIQVFNMLKEKLDFFDMKIIPDDIGALFFKHFPEYPAIKLIQKPFQYYIAPTDNFFHDASTFGNKEIDITLVYTGFFDMKNF
jgi:hypothetical protein